MLKLRKEGGILGLAWSNCTSGLVSQRKNTASACGVRTGPSGRLPVRLVDSFQLSVFQGLPIVFADRCVPDGRPFANAMI